MNPEKYHRRRDVSRLLKMDPKSLAGDDLDIIIERVATKEPGSEGRLQIAPVIYEAEADRQNAMENER